MTENLNDAINKRIVFIGDDTVGKSALINVFQETNPSDRVSFCKPDDTKTPNSGGNAIGKTPIKEAAKDSDSDSDESSVEDPALTAEVDAMLVYAKLKQDTMVYELALWDAANEADFKKQRAACYSKADIVVLVYAIDSRKSFKSVGKKWRSHVKKYMKNKKIPIILVGNKLDLRVKVAEDEDSDEDEEGESVSLNDGKKMAKKLGAIEHFECSALNKEGIIEIFNKAATCSDITVKPSKCLIS